jgi:hypothetical protein
MHKIVKSQFIKVPISTSPLPLLFFLHVNSGTIHSSVCRVAESYRMVILVGQDQGCNKFFFRG